MKANRFYSWQMRTIRRYAPKSINAIGFILICAIWILAIYVKYFS